METPDWVLAPTLGAIVPNWVIVVPRQPALNFRSWREQAGAEPFSIIEDVAVRLGVSPERILWFEHGPKYVGSPVGCGVDYAHLHLILDAPFLFEALMGQVREGSNLSWQATLSSQAYGQLAKDESYLVVGQGHRAAVAVKVDHIGSQFLRRMVAATAGQPDAWNYRHHPQSRNIAQTIETFRQFERVALHGD
jgi:ATP adenylyltransferase